MRSDIAPNCSATAQCMRRFGSRTDSNAAHRPSRGRLVKTTDQAFTAVTCSGPIARFLRLYAVPTVLPLLFSFGPMRRLLYRTVSQTDVNYRKSPLSAGQVGTVHGGDRLPWVKIGDDDNFAPLTSLDWQVHVHGEAAHDVQKICSDRVLQLHAFSLAP